MKKFVNVLLVSSLFFNSMGDGRLQTAQRVTPANVQYENSFLQITAGPDEEEGHLSIFCKEKDIVSAEIYAAYGGERFSVHGVMDGEEGALEFPGKDSSVDFYILAVMENGEEIKSNIVTFYHEDDYYYEITKDNDGDGIPDGYEIRDLGTNPAVPDTDGDGFLDGYEVQILHTDPLGRTKDEDYDGDGLKNSEEAAKGSNPYLWDTDFDGVSDKRDRDSLVNTGKVIVKKEQLPEFQRGYYDVKEIYQDENGVYSEVVTNILTRNVQWVKTRESYSRFFYDFEGKKPIAELTYYGETGEYLLTQLAYTEGFLTNINQNGSTKEIFYTENGQISQYYEEGELLYEKQYDGGQVSQIMYGNGDCISYQYNRYKDMIGMEINRKAAYTWKYNDEGMVSRYVDEREKIVENRTYDEWCELTERTQENGLSISYSADEKELSTVYRIGEEIKKVTAAYDDSDGYTIQYPQDVVISITSRNGESQKAILQSGKEIISSEKSEKQREKVKIEMVKKEKKEKDKGQQKKNNEKRDKIGNLIEQDGARYDWEGLLLKSYEKDGIKVDYAYDSEGNRIKKTVNGVESIYGIEEGNLIYEETEGETVWYYYGADGFPAAFETDGNMYIYEKDDEGNVIALYNIEGEAEAEYLYDDAGNLLEITGNQELGETNPFRYQSAYYDEESNLYYSYGRYYDTEEETFLNEDSLYEAEPNKEETYLSASYYGAAVEDETQISIVNSTQDVPADPESDLLSPTGWNRLYSWSKSCLKYNCYAYAIGKTNDFYEPGEISTGQALQKVTFHTVLIGLVKDFEAKGSEFKFVNKDYKPVQGEKMIAYKVTLDYDDGDFHFMKYISGINTWRHKPSSTAILTYQKSPDVAQWISERYSIKDRAWKYGGVVYNSSTVYFVYVSSKQYK